MMRKTIFARYFSMCGMIILVSITVLGGILLLFASRYFNHDKYTLLSRNVNTASGVVSREINRRTSHATTMMYLNSMSNAVGATFFFTDTSGKTLYCSEEAPCRHNMYLIPLAVLEAVDEGEYRGVGVLGDIYTESHYTVGISVKDENGNPVGYMFASSSAESMSAFLKEILKMFFFSAVAVVCFAFIVLYFVTLKITTPLKEMVGAAKRFGRGDFAARLKVENDSEISELAAALNNMAKDLSAVETMRRSFTANVSHELKTPATTISGFIDGILDGTIPPEEHKHYLRIVSEEIKRLSNLVVAMLNLSKIEAGELEIKKSEFNIFDMVARVVISLEQPIYKKRIEIRGLDRDKLHACGDPDLIYQVIYNLTENAIKFAGEDGYVEFRFKADSSGCAVSIRNSGMGISREDLPKVFDRFYKTDRSRGKDKNGVGLGLFIVRTIIHLHGGEITVRSEPGEYTEFEFTLPGNVIEN